MYSLLGIFSLSLPVVYGEGDKALGRLLAQLLTSSGDTSILAWIGKSGSFSSCLPANIIVFSDLPTSHIPLAITGAEMERTIARMRILLLNPVLLMTPYDGFLPASLFVGMQMKPPCLVSKLGPVLAACVGCFVQRRMHLGWWRLGRKKTSLDWILYTSFTHGSTFSSTNGPSEAS